MSLSSILQKIQSKGQIKNHPSQNTKSASPAALQTAPTYASNERTVDPVVARLKAARKAEREAKEKEARAKKGLAPKREPARPRATKPTGLAPGKNRTPKSQAKNPVRERASAPPEKKPKMSFSELMKKASSIDQSKMSIDLKPKTKTPEPRRKTPDRRTPERKALDRGDPRDDGKNALLRGSAAVDRSSRPQKPLNPPKPARADTSARGPLPMRQPSAKLQSQLLQRTGKGRSGVAETEEDDSDMGSFIASDEEEQVSYGQDYDRDEIWSMFNRGNKRSYYDRYDSDSDDMEATGAEIFEEEAISKRQAAEDDRRELLEEQRRAALKLARRKRT